MATIWNINLCTFFGSRHPSGEAGQLDIKLQFFIIVHTGLRVDMRSPVKPGPCEAPCIVLAGNLSKEKIKYSF